MAGLTECWRLRNATASALGLAEDQMRQTVQAATHEDLLVLLETFSPGRTSGVEWTRTFEPLIERLWLWRDDATMAALASAFQSRGPAWAGVAHALAPDHGAAVRRALRQPPWARHPALCID